ncbi:hypothetical protein LCGC14_0573070 [marine sediment metagenome]|uniref:Uncharacterized protein n=1 Tax=marine sediment metagenome TaxID=412755 RepID=A0A0F9U533_9ZZZZ
MVLAYLGTGIRSDRNLRARHRREASAYPLADYLVAEGQVALVCHRALFVLVVAGSAFGGRGVFRRAMLILEGLHMTKARRVRREVTKHGNEQVYAHTFDALAWRPGSEADAMWWEHSVAVFGEKFREELTRANVA